MNEDKALENKNEDTLIEEQHSVNLPNNRREEAENDRPPYLRRRDKIHSG